MSWLNVFSSIFSNTQEQVLPAAPSVIAAGSQWYGEISPTREEIVQRIEKDIIKTNPECTTINLKNIISNTINGVVIGSYRDYYANRHRILVSEVREDAMEYYHTRHMHNMDKLYFIAKTKILTRSMIAAFRKRAKDNMGEE